MSAAAELVPLPFGDPDPDSGPRRVVGWMIGAVALFIVAAMAWMSYAQLDVSVNARGSVVPPSRLQIVQSLEGGIVKEMLVSAGDKVRKGQVVARLDTAQYSASAGESQQYRLAALAGKSRMDALLAGRAPVFDDDGHRQAPGLVEREQQHWRDAQREYAASMTASREGVARRRSELAETESRIRALERQVKLGEESFAIEDRLFSAGAGSRADYLAAQQRLLALGTELEGLQKSMPRVRAGLAEAEAAASEVDARFRSQWSQQRNEFQTRAAALASTLAGQEDKVNRRDITSPMDGVVNRVVVPTLGGVAAPGAPILEIVPDEAELLMTVRVRPADVGFIHVGQAASVRVLAYDASVYGQLQARVRRVGADALAEERTGEPYFEVQLASAQRTLGHKDKALPITPGMPVEVGVLTGERSVLQYLLKPVLRGFQTSLQER